MEKPKLDERLEAKLKYLIERRLDHSDNPSFRIPVKIVPHREYEGEKSIEVSFAPNQPVRTREERNFAPGFQAVINKLEKLGRKYTPFIQDKYVITSLNARQIQNLAAKPYIEEILDDSPII
jgi:hypothetical protein